MGIGHQAGSIDNLAAVFDTGQVPGQLSNDIIRQVESECRANIASLAIGEKIFP